MQSLATQLRWAIEPFHAHCYFVDEVRTRFTDRGLHPWSAYFAQRSAPMGRASAAAVTAAFYGFSPELVGRAIPGVWDAISPETAWEWRLAGVDEALRRVLGDWCDRHDLTETTSRLREATDSIPTAGRPLGGPTAAMPPSDLPHIDLWLAISALRELRGDGHIAALITHGVGPVESILTSPGFSNLPVRYQQKTRGWDEDSWSAGFEQTRRQGWIDDQGELTDSGQRLRRDIESATDRSVADVITSLGDNGVNQLIELIGPASVLLAEATGIHV